jgi:hypothetical protein
MHTLPERSLRFFSVKVGGGGNVMLKSLSKGPQLESMIINVRFLSALVFENKVAVSKAGVFPLYLHFPRGVMFGAGRSIGYACVDGSRRCNTRLFASLMR